MITELNELGVYVKKNMKNFVPRFVTEEEIYKVICVLLKKGERQDDNLYFYIRSTVEDYSVDDQRPYKHYYFRGSSNGPNLTLASVITTHQKHQKGTDPEITLQKKVYRWLLKHEDDPRISSIKSCYDNNKDKIYNDVNSKFNDLEDELKSSQEKGKVLLDFKIDEGGMFLYPLEIPIFKELFDDDLHSEYCSPSHGNSVCYLCGEEKEVCGNVLPALGLKFSTLDKPGFTPGLDQSQFWKSVPICMQCAENLKFGYSYVLSYLDFPKATRKIFKETPDKVLGFRLMVIPRSINESYLSKFLTAIEKYKERKGLFTSEDGLISLYEDGYIRMPDSFLLTFLFYKKDKAKFQILRYISEVLPSRLWTVEYLLENTVRNQGTGSLWFLGEDAMHRLFGRNFSGKFIGGNNFFPTSNWFILMLHEFYSYRIREKAFLNDRFFEIIEAVFGGQERVNFDLTMDFMRKIRKSLGKSYNDLSRDVISSLVISYILRELENLSGEHKMDDVKEEKKTYDMEAFFRRLNLETDEERAAVAVGVLVSKVLFVQRKFLLAQRKQGNTKGKEPFWSKLNGLIIDHDRLRAISTQSIAKLREYQKVFPQIEQSVYEYLSRTDRSTALNKEKNSYYFTAGLVLGDTFWPEKEEKTEDDIIGDVNE